MPISDDEINRLLNLPRRGGGKKKSEDVDTRDYRTWFKLAHRMVDDSTGELLKCENPECPDTRTRGAVVVQIKGKYMCRFCFLAGWLLDPPQEAQDEEE